MTGRTRRQSRRTTSSAQRAQTETIGVVLVLSMTLVGATVAMAFGASALNDARIDSQEEGIENALTQLDSRSAMVALGDSSAQHVPLGAGTYRVDEDAGWMRVEHLNYSGTGSNEILYNDSLGAVLYERDGTTIAYQGGGVWKSTGDASTMVSPPEFHYRAATLTLPIIQVTGSDSVSGGVTAKITADPGVNRIYPNAGTFYGVTTIPYANPVDQGNVTVTVHSEYYQAWATFFETRTEGDITVYDSNKTVRVFLITPSTLGNFDMPNEGNGISVQEIGEDHPVNDFTITIQGDPHFENMHWAFYAKEDGQELEIHIHSPGKCQSGSYDDDLDLSVYYYNGSGSLYEGWQNSTVDPDSTPAISVDCSAGTMTIDFMGTIPLEYKPIDITGSDNKWYFGNQISDNDIDPKAVFDQHDIDDDAPRDGTYNASSGETEEIGFLVNHYIQRIGPSFELRVTDGPGGSSRVDESTSEGNFDYEQGGGDEFITFLHITENRVTVEIE